MVQYRRSQTPGGTYFFTVNLRDRISGQLVTHVDHLRQAFNDVCQQCPFEIIAAVVLPDHLHMIMKLPVDDNDYPGRWRAIKSRFTRALVKDGVDMIRNSKGEYNLWQRRYWEHQIRDEIDLQRHIDYIHFNPVKHGYVKRVVDWPYSSFHRYVKSGVLDENWGGNFMIDEYESYGE